MSIPSSNGTVNVTAEDQTGAFGSGALQISVVNPPPQG